jgi:hypothetical protein
MGFFTPEITPSSEFDIENEDIIGIDREENKTNISFYPKNGSDWGVWEAECDLETHNDFIKRLKVKNHIRNHDNYPENPSIEEYLQ